MADDGTARVDVEEADGSRCVVSNGAACIVSAVTVEPSRLDGLFEVLASRRRRFALYHLAATDEAVVERAALADAIIARMRQAAPGSDPPEREAVVRDLHHRVLPRLRAEGFIDYDVRQGTVRYDAPASLADCLSIVRQLEGRDDERPEDGR